MGGAGGLLVPDGKAQLMEKMASGRRSGCQPALPVTIDKINDQPDAHPDKKPVPGNGGDLYEQVGAEKHAEYGDCGKFADYGGDT